MHDQRDDYLAQRHAGLRTEAHIVFEWVKTATGCTPVTRQKIVRGNDSEVYRVETKEGHAFVIRIRHGGEVTFREEAWAIERCRQAGVRVPDVLLVDTMATETGEREVMVQRAVPGHPLADAAGSMSDEQLREALQEAGEELAKIHSIAAGGFYHYHIPHGWDFPDWEAISRSNVRNRSQERDLILPHGFSPQEFDDMIRWIEFYQRNFPCRDPVLCHGDYGPEHIFVGADGRLTGIIDFGMFQGGPRVHDFALYQLNRTEQERIWLLAGYERLHGMEEDFEARLQLHSLSLGLGFLAHETRIGNIVTAQNLAKRLRETFLWCQAYLGN